MAPSAMLFRDDKQTSFPRQPVRKVDTEMARDHDEQERQTEQNKSMPQSIEKKMLRVTRQGSLKEYKRLHKFDMLFCSQPYTVIGIDKNHMP